MGRMEHSQAKLEGLLEGLREAITGSRPARSFNQAESTIG